MRGAGHLLIERTLLPDDRRKLADQLRRWSRNPEIELILTTGGTGLAPRDVMPEATLEVVDRHAPGIAEAMRAASMEITPMAMISRAVAGIANRTLIINLPGNPKGAVETLDVVLSVLPHAVEIMTDTHSGEHPIHAHRENH